VKNGTASIFTFEPIFWPVTDQLLLTMQNLSTLDREKAGLQFYQHFWVAFATKV